MNTAAVGAVVYRSIDLFAGIGGIRKGFENAFGEEISTVFVSEWDRYAQETYKANYSSPKDESGETQIYGDITLDETKDAIPEFDICLAGFPCQAFSMAGRHMGFNDDYKGICRGTLFKDVAEICEKHQPKVIFCENVKGLTIHDRGKTFEIIRETFRRIGKGYDVFYKVLNSRDYGVPQNRERIYIVCFRRDLQVTDFEFPEPTDSSKCIDDIIEETPVSVKYYLSEVYLDTLVKHRARHEAAGHGFGYEIKERSSVSSALVCGGMGRERNLIVDNRLTDYTPVTNIKGPVNRKGIRKMTPREWARLQGFPDDFKLVLADTHLYKQFGNSVTVPVIEAIAEKILVKLKECENPERVLVPVQKQGVMMSTKITNGNAGEWSEPYVLLKLLADGKIYKSDEDLNIIYDVFHDIRSILFKENSKDKLGSLKYIIEPDDNSVTVESHGKPLVVIKRSECRKYAEGLKKAIQESHTNKGTVDVPSDYVRYLEHIGRKSLKASNKDTPDIWLDLPDIRNTTDKPLGFSIKSSLSKHPATIFNSSAASNLVYKITGNVTPKKIAELRSLQAHHESSESEPEEYDYPDYPARISKFKELGLGLQFAYADTFRRDGGKLTFKKEFTFEKNLRMIDSKMPEILAAMVSEMYFNGVTNMKDSTRRVDLLDPLGVKPSSEYPFYSKKVKDMLVAMTLSMVAGSVWDGSEGTNGGLIIVKEDGDIVCYHIFDRNDFKDFLLNNMRFECPSNARYFSMYIWEEGGEYYLTLAVQIRMGQKISSKSVRTLRGVYDLRKGKYIPTTEMNLDLFQ